MLTEKQFRERARTELQQFATQLKSIATDRATYRRFEQEIVEPNPLLHERSWFLDMLRGCYTDGMTARVLRLLEQQNEGVSLPGLLAKLAQYPHFLQDRISDREFADDRGALERVAVRLKSLPCSHGGHHERTIPALRSANCALDEAIDLLLNAAKTYYWIIADSYLDVDVTDAEVVLSEFQFAWAAPIQVA